jgi:hypothetical protein
MLRYLLSLLVPVRFRSVYAEGVHSADVQAGGHGNHFRDDDHADLVTVRWWQWRGRTWSKRTLSTCIARGGALALLCLALLPSFALAAAHGVGFVPSVQTWALILGAVTPLFTYVLNHYAPWISEAAKAIALAVVSGVVGAVWAAIETHVFGWNDATVQLVLTAILGAFGAHALVFKPAGINKILKGGTNASPAASGPSGRDRLGN